MSLTDAPAGTVRPSLDPKVKYDDRPKVSPLWSYNARRTGRFLKSHHTRGDGPAFLEVQAALLERGYWPGRQYLNCPPRDPEDRRILEIVASRLSFGDIVVAIGRPPLDDADHGDRIKIERGYTNFGEVVCEQAETIFDVLARSHIRLWPEVVAHLPAEYANRADMLVRVFRDAWYRECKGLDGKHVTKFRNERRTPAFLLRVNRLEMLRGADLLIVFGMGGTETLVWARRLHTEFSHLLDQPGFTMVELVLPNAAKHHKRTGDLAFADDWEIEQVLHLDEHEIRRPSGARAPHFVRSGGGAQGVLVSGR